MEPDEPKTITYAIYEHPSDYPAGYVVREWLSVAGETQPGSAQRANSLEEARALLPPGVTKIDSDDPDPTIIETYLSESRA
jgi:hypothetical protein